MVRIENKTPKMSKTTKALLILLLIFLLFFVDMCTKTPQRKEHQQNNPDTIKTKIKIVHLIIN